MTLEVEVDDTPLSGVSQSGAPVRPVGPLCQAGDVDPHGDLVDALTARLATGIGPVVGLEALDHLGRVRDVVSRERPVLGSGSWVRS